VVRAGVRRVLEPGNTTFIRYNRDGDRHAFAIVKPGHCVLLWLTTVELNALPRETQPPAPPVEPPIIVEEPVLEAPNKFDVVQRIHAERPDLPTTGEEARGAFVNAVAIALGTPWGRKRKGDGSMNTDVLAWKRSDGDIEYYDILNGDGSLSWGPTGPFKPGQNGNWVPPPQASEPPPPLKPPTPPVVVDLGPILARIQVLEEQSEEDAQLIRNILETLTKLESQKPIKYSLEVNPGSLFGAPYVKSVKLVEGS
jgi:hypothetical protein